MKVCEKIHEKTEICNNCNFDLKEHFKTVKKTLDKIEDYKHSISSMEKNLESIKNETLNVEGKI